MARVVLRSLNKKYDEVYAVIDVNLEIHDQGQVVQAGRERCREWLRSGRSFAFNATNLLRLTRQHRIDLFADY